MSGVARIMLARGIRVTGSDAKDVPVLKALESEGAGVWVGFHEAHQERADAIVMSSSIRDDNVELVAARERGVPVLHRAQGLAALMQRPAAGRRGGSQRQDDDDVDAHGRAAGLRPRPVLRRRRRAGQARHQRPRRRRRHLRRRGRRERRLVRGLSPRGRDRHECAARSPRLLPQLQGCAGGLRRLRRHDPPRWAARHVRRRRRRRGLAERARAAGTRVLTYGFDADADVVLARPPPGRRHLVGHAARRRRRAPDDARRARPPQRAQRGGRVRRGGRTASARTPTASSPASRPSPARDAGSSRRARRAASSSSTTTPTTPARSLPSSRPPRTSSGDTGRLVVVFQPHLYSRTRDFAAELGPVSRRPTSSSSWTSTPRARTPCPGCPAGSWPMR